MNIIIILKKILLFLLLISNINFIINLILFILSNNKPKTQISHPKFSITYNILQLDLYFCLSIKKHYFYIQSYIQFTDDFNYVKIFLIVFLFFISIL